MPVEAHLAELKRKHAELEAKLDELSQHPSASDDEIHDIKVRKLHLKEEIARLSQVSA